MSPARLRTIRREASGERKFAVTEISMLCTNEIADDHLLQILDHPLWLARAGSVALGLPSTLRRALCRAYATSGESSDAASIVKLASDNIRIGADQISRLRERIGLPATRSA
jgi:hypothetical protein